MTDAHNDDIDRVLRGDVDPKHPTEGLNVSTPVTVTDSANVEVAPAEEAKEGEEKRSSRER